MDNFNSPIFASDVFGRCALGVVGFTTWDTVPLSQILEKEISIMDWLRRFQTICCWCSFIRHFLVINFWTFFPMTKLSKTPNNTRWNNSLKLHVEPSLARSKIESCRLRNCGRKDRCISFLRNCVHRLQKYSFEKKRI